MAGRHKVWSPIGDWIRTDNRAIGLALANPLASLLYPRLWLYADKWGRFDAGTGAIARETMIVDFSAISASMDAIEAAGLIERWDVGGLRYGQIVDYDRDLPARLTQNRSGSAFPGPAGAESDSKESKKPESDSKGSKKPESDSKGSKKPESDSKGPNGIQKALARGTRETETETETETTSTPPSLRSGCALVRAPPEREAAVVEPTQRLQPAVAPPMAQWTSEHRWAAEIWLAAQVKLAAGLMIDDSVLWPLAQEFADEFGEAARTRAADTRARAWKYPVQWLRNECQFVRDRRKESGWSKQSEQSKQSERKPTQAVQRSAEEQAEWDEMFGPIRP